MLKLLAAALTVGVALCGCTLGRQTPQQQRERATAVAHAYLVRQNSQLPPGYTTRVTLSEWIPELAASELIYVIEFTTRRGRKEQTLYSVPVSAERYVVRSFDRMGVLRPVSQ